MDKNSVRIVFMGTPEFAGGGCGDDARQAHGSSWERATR